MIGESGVSKSNRHGAKRYGGLCTVLRDDLDPQGATSKVFFVIAVISGFDFSSSFSIVFYFLVLVSLLIFHYFIGRNRCSCSHSDIMPL